MEKVSLWMRFYGGVGVVMSITAGVMLRSPESVAHEMRIYFLYFIIILVIMVGGYYLEVWKKWIKNTKKAWGLPEEG